MKILFDVGGTKTRIAGTNDLESFSDPVVFETLKDFDQQVLKMKESAVEITGGEEIEAAAGDFAGPFGEDRATLFQMSSILEWGRNIPVKEKLEEALGANVCVVNDAALVGLGEAVYGAGRGADIVVYITISTSVGGAKISFGAIDERTYGFEPGWQIIDSDATLSGDGTGFDRLADLVSGRATEKREGKKPYEITDDAYWDKLAQWLAYGLHNTILHWSPHRVVLGGSMMNTPGIKVSDVEKHLEEVLEIYPKIPEIQKAELGDFGGLYGAMALLKSSN